MIALRVPRRSFLMALAGTAASSAFAGRPPYENAAASPRPPRRLVLLMQNNGTQQRNFWPTQGFTSPILEPLLSNPTLARLTTVVKGVFVPRDANGTTANEHDMGFARMFTGEKLRNVGNQPWGGGPSVDQLVARAWKVDSLNLAVLTSSVEPAPKPGFDHRRSFTYVGPGQHRLPTLDPFDAYTSLFSDGFFTTDPAERKKLLLRKSALDAVSADLAELRARLPPAEQQKIDLHAASVRDLELRIAAGLGGAPAPGASCALRPPPPRDYGATAPALLVNDESGVPDLVTTMLDLVATSLGCGVTRVATVQLGFGGGKWRFAWDGIDENVHDDLAHKDTSDDGSTPDNTAKLVTVNRWYASQVAYLAQRLAETPDVDGTSVLDNTLLVWANEFGRGDHNLANVPIVLIGGALGAPGGRLVDQGQQTFQRLGCTILNAMGLDAAGFGDAPACGTLRGV